MVVHKVAQMVVIVDKGGTVSQVDAIRMMDLSVCIEVERISEQHCDIS